MTLEKINVAITTVWRPENYIASTLDSRFAEYPACGDPPMSLVVGSPQTDHLACYRSLPGVKIIEMGSHTWTWIKNNDVRHKVNWNYHRCLTQCEAGERGRSGGLCGSDWKPGKRAAPPL